MNQEEKKKEPFVAYSIRLRRDQAVFLKTVKDAAAFIREALDVAILAYSSKPEEAQVLALNQRRNHLEKEIQRIKESEEYKDIMTRWSDESMIEFRERLEKYEKLHPLSRDMGNLKAEVAEPLADLQDYFAGSEAGPTEAEPKTELKQCYKIYHPSDPELYLKVDASTPEEALREAERLIDQALELDLERKNEYEFLKKAKEAYEEQIRRLRKEIEELKAKIIVIQ